MRSISTSLSIKAAQTEGSNFEVESRLRAQDRDLERLRPASLRILILLCALIALCFAFNLASPKKELKILLTKVRHVFIDSGQICSHQDSATTCKVVSFPPGEHGWLNVTTKLPIEYFFTIKLTKMQTDMELTDLLIPTIWGESSVFRNGILIFHGRDILDALTLLPGINKIRIVVTASSGQKLGIRGLFPPTILTTKEALRFRDHIIQEPLTWRLTIALQLMVVAILALFWVWSKNQPELLFFLILALIEILKNTLNIFYKSEGLTLFSPAIDAGIEESLRSISVFLAVPFALAVCRVPLRYMTDMPRKYGLQYLGIVVATTIALTSTAAKLPLSTARSLGFVAASTFFIIWLTWPRLRYLVASKLYSRFILSSAILAAVMVWYYRFAADLLHLYSKITTEYNNQLLFFVVMAGFLAFQFGKTEARFSTVKSLLARESVRKVENAPMQVEERRGFVVLVDIVGWTRKRRRIKSEETRNLYSQKTLEALFGAFDLAEFSVPQQHGDSVFFTCTSAPTRERFYDIVARCKALCLNRPTLAELGIATPEVANERFIARGTVFYGAYDIVIAESGFHKKEAFMGDAPESCARIIGNDPDPRRIRIVAGGELDAFRPADAPILVAEGKGVSDEPPWKYWEIG